MRIALISDIHANLVALDAVLADIEKEHVDQIVCLGDVAANGPQPCQVIQRVRDLNCPVVGGNTDDWFLVPQTYDLASEKERRLMAMLEWAMQQFSAADLAFMRAFPPIVELALDHDTTLLCFHGSPQSNHHLILATTPDDEIAPMLGNHRATVMAGGHTHRQMLRHYSETLLINPGSVGMPIERNPWGEYALIHSQDGKLGIEFKRVPFSVNAILQSARESGMPHFEWWAGEWLNQRQSANQSLPGHS